MDLDWNTSAKEVNGINLHNYVLHKRSYNSAVFVHKKYLEDPEPVEKTEPELKTKKEKKSKHVKKQDKSQQFARDNNRIKSGKTYKVPGNHNTVLDQTIRFAKNIVPLIIPPDEDKSNVFYTIKTSKKHRRTDDKPRDPNLGHHELAQEQEEPRKVVETYRKVKKESLSVLESISHSSNNTLEDLNINQSLCCTFSEVSEKKYQKKDKNRSKKAEPKFAISESFEAVAMENINGDAKIKIHLMNERDKHYLSDTIKEPILNAIRECILDLHNSNPNTESHSVQKYIKSTSQKLDHILEKLTSIEQKLDIHEKGLQHYEKKLGNQQSKLNVHEEILRSYEERFDSHERKIDSYGIKLSSYDTKLDSHEEKLNSSKILNSQIRKPNSHSDHFDESEVKVNRESKRLIHDSKSDPSTKESKKNDHKSNQEVEEKKSTQISVKSSNVKSSTLEELGADLIEMDEDFSSEEELHQELLDRRSKSTVVVEMAKEKRMENLGGGEVPPSVKGTSIGNKLERPNRIPARFCWTDNVRKN